MLKERIISEADENADNRSKKLNAHIKAAIHNITFDSHNFIKSN